MKLVHKLLLASSATASIAKAGQCPFGYTSEGSPVVSGGRQLSDHLYPSDLFTCNAGTTLTTTSFSVDDYEAIVEAVYAKYLDIDSSVTDNYNPRGNFAGCMIRLAGHDFMDYRVEGTDTFAGGADGCMNFEDGDNAGLIDCVTNSGVIDVYEDWCSQVSLADFIVILGEAVMGFTATDSTPADPFNSGSYQAQLRDAFAYGRTTVEECAWNVHLLPNPENGCLHLDEIFVQNIYYDRYDSWALTAAISGAHTVGSAKPANSGYEGWWSDAENSGVFNNDYYLSLIGKGWIHERAIGGNTAKNQWKRGDFGQDQEHHEIMLRSDLCLAYDTNIEHVSCKLENADTCPTHEFDCDVCSEYVDADDGVVDLELDLGDEADCCAWVRQTVLEDEEDMWTFDWCGIDSFGDGTQEGGRRNCCSGEEDNSWGDCDDPVRANGPAYNPVFDFMYSESLWLDYYHKAWEVATTNGFDDLTYIVDQDDSEAWITDAVDCENTVTTKLTCTREWECEWVVVSTTTRNNGSIQETSGCRHVTNDL